MKHKKSVLAYRTLKTELKLDIFQKFIKAFVQTFTCVQVFNI